MALIACPECKVEMSDTANSCPKCGFNLHAIRKQSSQQAIVGVGIVLAALINPIASMTGLNNWLVFFIMISLMLVIQILYKLSN